ncbi:MAG: heavy metal translocating P-type ATPase [Gemmatimonadota bacterium]|nr:heavy metal translocating P-type ATPase [Gemmatimonadota bacterium]
MNIRAYPVTGAGADVGVAPQVACTHCGLDAPPALRRDDGPQFCCSGCETAYAVINGTGLEAYYRFGERRATRVQATGRSFEEFDHAAFATLYVRRRADGLSETELYLENVHCASCVWLVERASLTIPGVHAAELDVGRSRVRLAWDARATRLSNVARFLDSLGYVPHPWRGRRADDLRRAEDRAALVRIGVAGAIAGNVMLIALALYAGWFGGMEREFARYFRWWSLALATPALLWPGRVFFRSAGAALRRGTLHVDVPIALALAAGWLHGAVNTIRDSGPVYFDGVATLVFLLLVGRFLQQRAQRAAVDAAELLASLAPSTARVVEGGTVREVPREAVLPGATIEVRAGDTIAADGLVVEGASAVDLSLLTGESRPVPAGPGTEVFAGTVNLAAPIRVRVTGTGEASRLGALLTDVEAAAQRRSPVVHLADRMAGWFVATVLALAAVTAAVWFVRDPSRAVDNAIAVLIVTCPCALALATPLAITSAVGKAAARGILVRGGDALESLARAGTIILDKTGTVTEGRLAVVEWTGAPWVRPLVVALERHSRHPVAVAFLQAWAAGPLAAATDVTEEAGSGIAGIVSGRSVAVGTEAYARRHLHDAAAAFPRPAAGCTPAYVVVDGQPAGVASFDDAMRTGAAASVAALRRAGWRVELLSGDAPDAVARAAAALGIRPGDARGGVAPEGKRRHVEQARHRGPVVMVGDGVNDAAAMTAATVGVGVHGGAEACLASADVFTTRAGLGPVVELVGGARRTMAVIRAGIGVSIAYNIAGAGLAVAGRIDPLVAAILMPLSSLTVVLLAWRAPSFGPRAR